MANAYDYTLFDWNVSFDQETQTPPQALGVQNIQFSVPMQWSIDPLPDSDPVIDTECDMDDVLKS